MTDCKTRTLKNIDPEDIGDTLMLLADSFNIKYGQDDFKTAKTFGDLCDIVERRIALVHKEDCTTQQAFYKVRMALSQLDPGNDKVVTPQMGLEEIFPRSSRRKLVRQFETHLGGRLNFLEIKEWLSWIIFIGFITSLIVLFFKWKIAITGFILFYLIASISGRFANELGENTVGDLASKFMREHYTLARRHSGTMNKSEIFILIQNFFSKSLDLEKEQLTRESPLSWN